MSNAKALEVRDRLSTISSCFCLAKWYQVTIHLQNGHTHSCHHPFTHQVGLKEIEESPSALHNTVWKKYQRYKMLKNVRPSECDYCWKIEDSNKDSISDRTFKSSEEWALPYFDEAANLELWDKNINPRYVEVSFGHACNFKCMYCAPHISSSIMNEYVEHGHYQELEHFSLDSLKRTSLMPIGKDDYNPYINAFWDWWPSLVDDLDVFRITGGEPLVNPNTFKFLDFISNNPAPNLSFAVNSNLGIPDAQFDRFLFLMKDILENKKIKRFEFYTSVDTFGPQAEYIRNGLNYDKYISNVRKFLDFLPEDTKVIFMCTYNALSVVGFRKFLEDVKKLKEEYYIKSNYETRVILDLPYLKDPRFMSIAVLTDDFLPIMEADLEYMKSLTTAAVGPVIPFTEHEVTKMQRIINWFESLKEDDDRNHLRRKFYSFYFEYDKRKKTNFNLVFPEMKAFQDFCSKC